MIEYASERAERRAKIVDWLKSLGIAVGVMAILVVISTLVALFPDLCGIALILAIATAIVHCWRHPNEFEGDIEG